MALAILLTPHASWRTHRIPAFSNTPEEKRAVFPSGFPLSHSSLPPCPVPGAAAAAAHAGPPATAQACKPSRCHLEKQ